MLHPHRHKLLAKALIIICSAGAGHAFSGETLESLLRDQPQISVYSGSSAASTAEINYRGFSAANNAINQSSPLAVTVDGLPRLQSGLSATRWFDLEEVSLQSQASTTFNPSGALLSLNLKTRKPVFSSRSARAVTSVESNDFRSLDAAVNYGFDDGISAYRLATSYFESGGSVDTGDDAGLNTSPFDENRSSGGRGLSVRGQYRLAPVDSFELLLAADYDKSDITCCGFAALKTDNDPAAFFGVLGLPADGGFADSGEGALSDRRSNSNDSFQLNEVANYSASSKFTLAKTQLKLASIYSEFDSKQRYSIEGSTLDVLSVRENSGNQRDDFGERGDIRSISHQVSWNNHSSNESILWELGASYSLQKAKQGINTRLGSDYQRYYSALVSDSLGGSIFPNINPTIDPNVLSTLAGGTANGEGDFANNRYRSRKQQTRLYWNNRWVLNERLSLQAGVDTLLSTEEGAFEQRAAESTACANSLDNLGPLDPQSELYRIILEAACPAAASAANLSGIAGNTTAQTFEATQKTSSWGGHLNAELRIGDSSQLSLTLASTTTPGGVNLNPIALSESATTFDEQKQISYLLQFESESPGDRFRVKLALFHYQIKDLQTTLPFDGSHDFAKRALIFNINKALLTGFETQLSFDWSQSLRSTVSASYIDQRSSSNCSVNTDFSTPSLCDKRFGETPETQASLVTSYSGPTIAGKQVWISTAVRYEAERELEDYMTVASDSRIDASLQMDLELALKPIEKQSPRWELTVYARNLGDQPARGFFTLAGQPDSLGSSFSDAERYGMQFKIDL